MNLSRVTKSTKLGIASAVLLFTVFLPPSADWRGPINIVVVIASAILGALAARQGSKWWLLIPCAIASAFVIGLIFTALFHTIS